MPRLLQAMAPHPTLQGEGSPRLTVVGRRVTGRSRLYFLGEADRAPTFVAKVPLADAPSHHPPLDAPAQFEALRRSHAWFRQEDRHAVVEPVACLPDLGALVMRHAPGPTVAASLARALADPVQARQAVGAAGDFLRRFHAHGAAADAEVDLRALADDLGEEALAVLTPLGLQPTRAVLQALREAPRSRVAVRQVLRHGDFVGANLIVSGPNSVTMIDPSLAECGLPDDDLARFLAHLSSTTSLMAGLAWPPAARLRRELEQAFLAAYGSTPNPPAVFEIRLLRQLLLRWARRTEHAMARASGTALRAQRLVVDLHMGRLLDRCAVRLRQALREPPFAEPVG
ncbi:aminoglycoside phosphotransferase family protein [Phenylobacterium sp.]|uniref:aminoglycoside phosphotransferase family protein n=1 Tax=Phenylobacterium sp. TaxID=1871053 RepID=UPI0035AFA5C7